MDTNDGAITQSRSFVKKQDEEESSVPKEISAGNSLEDRREELRIMLKGQRRPTVP